MKKWELQNAGSRFRELVQNAEQGEAQVATEHGKEVAVVLSYRHFLELAGRQRSALDSFRDAPDLSGLALQRHHQYLEINTWNVKAPVKAKKYQTAAA